MVFARDRTPDNLFDEISDRKYKDVAIVSDIASKDVRDDQLQALAKIAAREDRTTAYLVRQAIDEFLQRNANHDNHNQKKK